MLHKARSVNSILANKVFVLAFLLGQLLCQFEEGVCYDSEEVVKARNVLREAQKCNNVWMSKQEQDLLMSYLKDDSDLLEVGSGYSTLWYSQFVRSYVSIEHDLEWYTKILQKINEIPGKRNITYHSAPVEWDLKNGDGTEEAFAVYLNKIDEVSHGRLWDVVLDDGRARVPVAQRVLKYLKPDSIVIIHDFWKRKHYHDVLQWYDVVATVHIGQTIVILKPKAIAMA
eukprot:TRINITY_DN876_c0_g4_i1.p2 TRINITY_DN876_c0_g4~~TRINITY_DN876_c0_g4_i1.p2  ORF type:complete len:228 (+),score=20.80 TRINITY_DN876_c0_g4_i1:94-777(+)